MEFIKAENLTFSYDVEDNQQPNIPVKVINDLNLSVKKGEFLAIIGHNGSGKSTLSKHFNGILLPTGGQISVEGMSTSEEDNVYKIRRKVGLVLQNPDNQLVASIIEEDVAFGPENLGVEPERIRELVDSALKAVDMYEYRTHSPHKLSGGQKQRIAIAGILAMEPDCIVLDEPTSMLDPKGREEVIRAVTKLNKERGITVILITHNMDETVDCDRVVVMDKGEILTEGTPHEVFAKVELLKKHRLDVPQATELCKRLRDFGLPMETLPIDTDECIKFLEEVLS